MSYVVGTIELTGSGSATLDAAWQAPLAALIGTYAVIQQHQVLRQQVSLGQRAVTVGEQFADLAESQYSAIAVPVFDALNKLFLRYKTTFQPYELVFVDAAMAAPEYTLQYAGQANRVRPLVDASFDNATGEIDRQNGTYVSAIPRFVAPVSGFLAITRSLTTVDAVNRAYRYEEDRLKWWSQHLWQRFAAGGKFVEGMARNVASGLNQGAAASQRGLAGLSGAYSNLMHDFSQKEGALANLANMWGSVANGATQFSGYGAGGGFGHMASNRANINQVTPGFLPPLSGGPVSYAW